MMNTPIKILLPVTLVLAVVIIFKYAVFGYRNTSAEAYAQCSLSDNLANTSAVIQHELYNIVSRTNQPLQQLPIDTDEWTRTIKQLQQEKDEYQKAFYMTKQKNNRFFAMQQQLQDSIKNWERCKAKISLQNKRDCLDLIKRYQNSELADVKKQREALEQERRKIELLIENQKRPKPIVPGIKVRDFSKEIRDLKDQINTIDGQLAQLEVDLESYREKHRTWAEAILACQHSSSAARVCGEIKQRVSSMGDKESTLEAIHGRILMKQRQIESLNRALALAQDESEAAGYRLMKQRDERELSEMISKENILKQNATSCQQLCSNEKKALLEKQRHKLMQQQESIMKKKGELAYKKKEHERKIQWYQEQTAADLRSLDNQPSAVSSSNNGDEDNYRKLTEIFQRIRDNDVKLGKKIAEQKLMSEQFARHARNIEILNQCAVKRKIAENLQSQVEKLANMEDIQKLFKHTQSTEQSIIALAKKLK